jgi:hypothetical protein
MENEEGDALLREVIDHVLRPELMYFHDWQPDDMVLWDNWRMLHCSTGVAPGEVRIMRRTTIVGDYGLGRVDKRDSQILLLLIQDCFLRISHGSRGFVGCGVGPDWAAAAA